MKTSCNYSDSLQPNEDKKKNSQILSNKIVNIYYIEEVKNSCVSSYSPSLSTIS